MNNDRYTRTAVFLHWLLVIGLFCQIGFGWYLQTVPRGSSARTIDVNLHKSTGIVLALLILFRLYWRLTHTPPAYPITMPGWERASATWSHILLYACMILMPLSGYLASNFSKYGVNFFNTWKFAPWGPEDKAIYAALNGTHVITSYVLVILIALHILAALHHLFRRDSVFSRMWTARSES
jgi:cytochrome b561